MSSDSIVPTIRYAQNGPLNLAFQLFGAGPVDIVLVPGFISHIEYAWHEPLLERFLRRLATFARVIAFDKRGMGLSDRDPNGAAPTLDERVSDISAVLDAVGSPAAALLAWSEGGPAAVEFAHHYPHRTTALLLFDTTARFSGAEDYPEGIPREILELFIDTIRGAWGSGVGFELYAPSLADNDRARAWWSSYQRFAATPGAVAATLREQLDVDVRERLPGLDVPTLVFHRRHDMVVPVECGRYLAAHIPNAVYVEPDSEDHMYWVGDQEGTLAAIRQTLASTPRGAELLRVRRPRRASEFGWDSLTNTELDIVRLVALGLTNAEIAARFTVSPRTVQTHVRHVLAKLGAKRRSEIAAEASRRGF